MWLLKNGFFETRIKQCIIKWWVNYLFCRNVILKWFRFKYFVCEYPSIRMIDKPWRIYSYVVNYTRLMSTGSRLLFPSLPEIFIENKQLRKYNLSWPIASYVFILAYFFRQSGYRPRFLPKTLAKWKWATNWCMHVCENKII